MEIIHKTESNEIDKLLPLKNYINSMLEKPNNSDIYHYTTIEALYNGILRKEAKVDEEICLRSTSALYLNDPEEIKIGLSFIEKLLYGNSGRKILDKQSDVMDACSEYFITSFSQDGDSLPMWSMYAANATGIALCFDKKIINNDSWFKCIYYNDKIQREVEEILASLCDYDLDIADDKYGLLIFFLFLLLIVIAYDKNTRDSFWQYIEPIVKFTFSLKNPAYSYEEEVRLLYTSSDEDKDKIKHRFKNNLIVPYIEQYFPKESLKEIIVGPNNDMERTIYSLEKYLKHIGFEHVKVTPSKVPYRS